MNIKMSQNSHFLLLIIIIILNILVWMNEWMNLSTPILGVGFKCTAIEHLYTCWYLEANIDNPTELG